MDPGDIPLLGFKIGKSFYLDKCPSFGARLSGSTCQRTTSAVAYLMRKTGYTVLVYLDDFCGIEPTLEKSRQAYEAFRRLAGDLGLQLAPHKCAPPASTMEWLGFELDAMVFTFLSLTSRSMYNIECDSTMESGGGHSDTHYCIFPYTAKEKKRCTHITQHKAVNLVAAYRTVAPQHSIGMKIILHTDNIPPIRKRACWC